MKEVTGNLWTYPADVRVITTNGFTKKNGEAVMGRGCALEAKERWPYLPKLLGSFIQAKGNLPAVYCLEGTFLLTFPVKHKWFEKADIQLIEQGAKVIAGDKFSDLLQNKRIVMPRPGCGNGQLDWNDVRPVLEPILDDRFHVITFGKE